MNFIYKSLYNSIILIFKFYLEDGKIKVTKIAIDPVWWLPGIAKKFNISEDRLRTCLFEQTGGMYPELINRKDLDVFLPPIGSSTVYIIGPIEYLSDETKTLYLRLIYKFKND